MLHNVVMCQMAGLDGDDWFVRREDKVAALEAAQRATVASAFSGSNPESTSGAVLKPFVDHERIQWLSTLDADVLRFLTDLEQHRYSQDILIKWSLHPIVGPKLMSGKWMEDNQLPDVLQQLYRHAQLPWEGVDFNFQYGPPPGAA
eukprot:jgi/Chrzof1/10483/Cz05g00080.t1